MRSTNECVVTINHENPIVAMGIAAMLAGHSDIAVADTGIGNPPHPGAVDVAICGYESALALLGPNRTPNGPRVLIVADASQEFVVRAALKAGARGYLLIGSCDEELVHAVWTVARGLHYICRAVAPSLASNVAQDPLTGRELDVLRLLVEGLGNKVIAARLDIAVGTVKCHMKAIMEKLGAATRTEAASVAMRRGIVAAAERPLPREGRQEAVHMERLRALAG